MVIQIVTEETPENSDVKNETTLEDNSENSNNEEENTEDQNYYRRVEQ